MSRARRSIHAVRSTLLASGLLLLWTANALAAPLTSAGPITTTASGPIAAAGSVLAWTEYDASDRRYHIHVVGDRPGAPAPHVLEVISTTALPDLGAGIGPDGAVWLVWSRCVHRSGALLRCDVVRYDLANPGERLVAVTIAPRHIGHGSTVV